jgi:hypothetical protein
VPGPQLGGKELFYVNPEFLETAHGELGCITCHGGQNLSVKDEAHEGMIVYPSKADAGGLCTLCHTEVGETFADSIHYTVQGMRTGLEEFGHPGATTEDGNILQEAFDSTCYKCHTNCGSCHVSRPYVYTGGLHSEHMFAERPPMEDTCFGCHGARSAGEYMGTIGYSQDVHFEAGMDCMDCHDVSNFHGTGEVENRKWDANLPKCTDCHGNVYEDSDIEAHQVHDEDLMNCQVCHSASNNNCFDCHVQQEADGSIVAPLGQSRVMFKIGLNPDREGYQPYKYITLRHVPTSSKMLEGIGLDVPNFDDIPSWKYSPTHNVQRSTIQNESCDSCHGNEYIFLRESDLEEGASEANKKLIVQDIP